MIRHFLQKQHTAEYFTSPTTDFNENVFLKVKSHIGKVIRKRMPDLVYCSMHVNVQS